MDIQKCSFHGQCNSNHPWICRQLLFHNMLVVLAVRYQNQTLCKSLKPLPRQNGHRRLFPRYWSCCVLDRFWWNFAWGCPEVPILLSNRVAWKSSISCRTFVKFTHFGPYVGYSPPTAPLPICLEWTCLLLGDGLSFAIPSTFPWLGYRNETEMEATKLVLLGGSGEGLVYSHTTAFSASYCSKTAWQASRSTKVKALVSVDQAPRLRAHDHSKLCWEIFLNDYPFEQNKIVQRNWMILKCIHSYLRICMVNTDFLYSSE